jgi:hypothetical protein
VAQGGEGKAKAGLARGSNGGKGRTHREDESAEVLLRDSAGAAHFGCRRWMRGKRGNEGCHAGGRGFRSGRKEAREQF